MSQVSNDPQVLHREMIQHITHPTAGELKLTGPPVKYSETPATIRTAPPLLGQHTEQVLTELVGMTRTELDALKQSNIIKQYVSTSTPKISTTPGSSAAR
jgi:crotonobetainyl-CoA:carnitine CoA-transferase CaiB-like acyl-CoA transferase